MSKTGTLKTDQLFKGLTRPPMLFGVSFTFFALNFLLTLGAYVMTKDAAVLLVFGPVIHLIGYLICFKEPLFVELFMIKSQRCSHCKNKFYHGANSYDVM